jgi:hypothetical protein
MPTTILVETLAETDTVCRKTTIGHIGIENTQVPKSSWVKVKGIQNIAMIKSENARFNKNGLISVFDRLPLVKTMIVVTFPTIANSVVREYNIMNTTATSRGHANGWYGLTGLR